MPSPGDGLNELDSMRARRARPAGGTAPAAGKRAVDPRLAGGPKRTRPTGHGGGGPATSAVVLAVPLDQLGLDPRNRKSENIFEDPKTHALAKSMARMGQLQSGVAVPREVYLEEWPEFADTVTTPLVVMVGNRRRAGHEINGTPTMDVVIRGEVTPYLAGVPIHENIHRKDLNAMDLADWLAEQRPEYPSQEALAEACAMTQAWVSQHLTLTRLIPELQDSVRRGEISNTIRIGQRLAKLPEDDQRAVWQHVADLDHDGRVAFWDDYGRARKPKTADTDHAGDQPGAEESTQADSTARPRPIVIRIGAWSAPKVVKTLRDTLTDEQWDELVAEITSDR